MVWYGVDVVWCVWHVCAGICMCLCVSTKTLQIMHGILYRLPIPQHFIDYNCSSVDMKVMEKKYMSPFLRFMLLFFCVKMSKKWHIHNFGQFYQHLTTHPTPTRAPYPGPSLQMGEKLTFTTYSPIVCHSTQNLMLINKYNVNVLKMDI